MLLLTSIDYRFIHFVEKVHRIFVAYLNLFFFLGTSNRATSHDIREVGGLIRGSWKAFLGLETYLTIV